VTEAFSGAERARELHAKGLGCNAIARELGVSSGTVSKWAKREGLAFNRSSTAVAVAARAVDLKERRQKLIDRLFARAEANLDRVEQPYRWRVVTGAGHSVVTDTAPPAADELRHSQAIANYLKTAAQLGAVDGGKGTDDAKSMLAQLGRALGIGGAADAGPSDQSEAGDIDS
jgi:predicted transcriptional regulator